jgi:type I restriction enzyme S subunit
MAGRYKPYPEYTDSGSKWLGMMPAHWSATKIGFLSHKTGSGKTPKGGSEVYLNSGVLFLRSQNIYDTGLRLDDDDLVFISEETDAEMAGSRVQSGDILLNITGASIGRTCIVPEGFQKANVNQHVCIIRVPVSLQRFLALYLKSATAKAQIDSAQSGAAREGLNFEQLSNIAIFMPKSEIERELIANFLDHETAKIDTLIEKQKQLIQLLKEKRQAVISHTVTKGLNPNTKMRDSGVEWLGEIPDGWEISKLKYHTILFEQGWSPQCDSRQAEGNEFGVLKVGCVNHGTFNSDENKALPKELTPQLQYLIQQGDLLISRANTKDLVGSAAVVDRAYDNIILCDKLYRLRFNELIEPQWVAYYLALPIVRQQIELGASGASHSMQNIGQSTIKELPIVIPSPEEVTMILSKIKNKIYIFELTLSRANKQIALLQERRTALISAAVTGKIDVRDWIAPQISQTNKEVAA